MVIAKHPEARGDARRQAARAPVTTRCGDAQQRRRRQPSHHNGHPALDVAGQHSHHATLVTQRPGRRHGRVTTMVSPRRIDDTKPVTTT